MSLRPTAVTRASSWASLLGGLASDIWPYSGGKKSHQAAVPVFQSSPEHQTSPCGGPPCLRQKTPPFHVDLDLNKNFQLPPGQYIDDTPICYGVDLRSTAPVKKRHPITKSNSLNKRLAVCKRRRKPLRIEISEQRNWSQLPDVFLPVINTPASPCGRNLFLSPLESISNALILENLDNSTLWRGLTLTDSELLLHIHQVFEKAIMSLVSGQLIDLLRPPSLSPYESANIQAGPLSAKSGSETLARRLNLSLGQLADSITWMVAARAFNHRGLMTNYVDSMVQLYMSTCDCLIFNSPSLPHDGAIDIQIDYGRSDISPRIIARSYPDFLSFSKVDYQPYEGRELIIIPQYRSIAFDQASTTYSLETPLTWLRWDDRLCGWRGTVPLLSEIFGYEGHSIDSAYRAGYSGPFRTTDHLRIVIKATRIKCYEHIRIERSVRGRLNLKVLPVWAEGAPSNTQPSSVDFVKKQCFSGTPCRPRPSHAELKSRQEINALPKTVLSLPFWDQIEQVDALRAQNAISTGAFNLYGATKCEYSRVKASRQVSHVVRHPLEPWSRSESVLDEGDVLHPASAEVLAIAEGLQKQPAQRRCSWKRSYCASYEDLPETGVHENEPRAQKDTAGTNELPSSSDPEIVPRTAQISPQTIPLTPRNDIDFQQLPSPASSAFSGDGFDNMNKIRASTFSTSYRGSSDEPAESHASAFREIIVDDDLELDARRQQALLWKDLNEQSQDSDDAHLNPSEREELLKAMKQSEEAEEKRKYAKLGIDLCADFSMSEDTSKSDQESQCSEDEYEESDLESGHASGVIRTTTIDADAKKTSHLSRENCNAGMGGPHVSVYGESDSDLSSGGVEAVFPNIENGEYSTKSNSSLSSDDSDMEASDSDREIHSTMGFENLFRAPSRHSSHTMPILPWRFTPYPKTSPTRTNKTVPRGKAACKARLPFRERGCSLGPEAFEQKEQERGRPRERAFTRLFETPVKFRGERTPPSLKKGKLTWT